MRRTARTYAAVAVAVAAAMLLAGPATAAVPAAAAGTGPAVAEELVTPLIVGGRPASQVYRGLGSLQYARGTDPDWHTCAVNLWTPWHAVTNAHCVTSYPDGLPKDPAIYKVQWSAADRLAGRPVTGVTRIVVHELWDWGAPGGDQGDIAVLWLDRPVVQVPSALPPSVLTPPAMAGRPARIAGWGYTSMPPATPAAPRYLSEADMRIVDPAACAAAGIDAGEICVADPGQPGAAACFGDSGGPVMTPTLIGATAWTLAGTASRETSPDCTGPTVYTSTAHYRPWITGTITGRTTPAPYTAGLAGVLPGYRWAGCGTSC
ncbi:S1 family peptidase [Catenuloplanes japonicus]|uniref:S1 family peptidase n=1 Tax=Catenuloplanes japonicus TaxID=33876 RepID=UPI0012F75683|nr:trypsin-like serine protease [Catenuloplanes japonicus]